MNIRDLEQWFRDEIARIQAGCRCEDPMPTWAEADFGAVDSSTPVYDNRPLARVIPLFPQPDGTRCACAMWGQASCRMHQKDTR